MASAEYDGGIGGKFRKRPFRRGPATPYDRPESAVRSLRENPMRAEGNGWLSKLVDPASRIITRSASKLFSSVFRKRLTAPPAPPEGNLHSRHKVPEVISSSELWEEGGNAGANPANNHDTDGTQLETSSGTDRIFELEQLLKQKTFTRAEFDHLTDLLLSRTIEPNASQPAVYFENKEKANISDQVQQNQQSAIEPSTSQPVVSNEKKEKANVSEPEDGIRSVRLHGNITNPAVNLTIPEDEVAAVAEIAKAYMGPRPSRVSPSTQSLRSHIYQEDTTLPSNVSYAKKPSNVLTASRSAVHFSGFPELSENGYVTPRPRGRSAVYKMSRSSYFKAHPSSDVRGGRPSRDGYAGPSTSFPWIPPNIMHSGGEQVLKRGSSVLDSNFGSFGPIRRIRRKSNLMSPSKDIDSSPPGNILPTPTTPLCQDVNQWSTPSVQKPQYFNELKYGTTDLQDAENGHGGNTLANGAHIPLKSSEMARKIFEQLDRVGPSTKEKSSGKKGIARDGSPSKLTLNVLHGQSNRSLVDIDSSKFSSVQGSGNLDAASDSPLPCLRSSISQKQDRVEENGPSKAVVSEVDAAPEAVGMDNSVISATDAKSSQKIADFAVSGSAVIPLTKKQAFQMSAAEDSLELDSNKYNMGSASGLLITGNAKLLEKSLASSSKSMPASTSILERVADVKASDRLATEKGVGFIFPVAPASSTFSQRPPAPAIPSPSVDRSAPQKEEISAPAFKFGSKGSSSTTTAICDPASVKFGASVAPTAALPEGSYSDRGGKTQTSADSLKSVGNAASSGLSISTSPVLLAFGASTSSNLSCGSQTLTSSTFTDSAGPAAAFSDSSTSSVFSTSTGTTTNSSSPSIFSAAPIFTTIPSVQFCSGTLTGAPISVSPSMDKSDSRDLEGKPLKGSPFGIKSSITPGTSNAFSNTGITSSAPATSSLFSSTGSGSSCLSTSSSYLSTANGIFGFSASARSSFANNSSPNSTTPFIGTAGPVSGTQATQAGSGISNFPQSSASQFGSFTSPPTFGLNASSSLGSGCSPFGSATSGATPFCSNAGFSFSTAAGSSSSASCSSFAPTAASSLFSSSSQPSSSSIFGSTFGSSSSLPSTGFSFGLSATTSGCSPSTSGASSGPAFSFASAGTTTSASASHAHPVFGIPTPAVGFSSGSLGNDQMNVEDSMADDTFQTAVPVVPTFGQPANSPPTLNIKFGTPAAPSGPSVFQFGNHQNSSVPQNPSPFQAAGSLEFSAGGSFSLGSGGGDKSGRRIVRVRRDKLRKK